MKKIAVIQAHTNDLLGQDRDPGHYLVGPLLASGVFDRIVLAAPDDQGNQVYRRLCREWGIDCFLGSEFDVADRIGRALEHVGAAPQDAMCRVLLNRFYMDLPLVDKMMEALQQQAADCVLLPYDFDINFAGDIFTVEAFQRLRSLLANAEARWRFHLWLYPELHPESFCSYVYEDVPSYPRSKLDAIRDSGLFSERSCGSFTGFTYEFIAHFVKSTDVLLDIACGTGDGTAELAGLCREAHGGDYSQEVVREASDAHPAPNLKFTVQDAQALTYPSETFDLVVTSNTLEHLPDDELALKEFARVAKPGGRIVVEVPILRRRPFNFPILSCHLREYDKDELLGLLERSGFSREALFGMNRGQYLEWERARESVLVSARVNK
jgi:SAM-dependent methyltransferase